MSEAGFAQLMARFANAGRDIGLCVAGGNDPEVINATADALRLGLVGRAVVTGDAGWIAGHLPKDVAKKVDLHDAETPAECAEKAVAVARVGEAGILMKGHVDSTSYLRAIVSRKNGLRDGGILSNVTVAEMASYPKFLAATDNGIVPAPDLDQKRQIILNTALFFVGLVWTRSRSPPWQRPKRYPTRCQRRAMRSR